MDAEHFRQRAARARELAQSGDDVRLSRMLLDVAIDLDAEAAIMEAEMAQGLGQPRRMRRHLVTLAGQSPDLVG